MQLGVIEIILNPVQSILNEILRFLVFLLSKVITLMSLGLQDSKSYY